MEPTDRERFDYYQAAWSYELGRKEKEALLKSVDQHRFLAHVWESQFNSPTWLSRDAIDQVLLIDNIGQGGMSYVCRAVSNSGQVLCVKFPNYDAHPPESWSLLELAITNEAKVLRRLADGQNDLRGQHFVGRLPQLVSSGQLPGEGRQCPYVITKYLFDLQQLESLDVLSPTDQLRFWTATSQLFEDLHRHQIVHADLHSGNLMMDANGRPVLLDFGNSQLREHWLSGRGVKRRFFGPLLALHVDEVLAPHRRLTPAFDVMCLAELIRKHTCRHFVSPEDLPPGLLTDSLEGEGFEMQSARLHRLIKICTEPEPEYRLPHAQALTVALGNLSTGQAVESQRHIMSGLKVLLRKHMLLATSLCAGVLLMLALLAINALSLRQQQLISQHLTEQVTQDAAALKRLRASNAAALESMRELLQGAIERDRVLEGVSSRAREQVGQRLMEMLQENVLEDQSEIAALDLALQVAVAMIELDGLEAAWPITARCRASIDHIQSRQGDRIAPELPLFEVQTDALLSRILYQRRGQPGGNPVEAGQRTAAAAQRYLNLSSQMYDRLELRKAYMATGYQLAWHGLYIQRTEERFRAKHGELLYQVLTTALAASHPAPQGTARETANLRRLFGLAMHKGVFKGSPYFATSDLFGELSVNQYQQVLEMLEHNDEALGGVSTREARQIEAAVKSVLGMSLTNQTRFLEAQSMLRDAYVTRQRAAEEFPGSIGRQREYIHTGWNYADAFRGQAHSEYQPKQVTSILLQEIEIRSQVVTKCLQLLARDRSSESEHDYLINAVRLANAYHLSGQNDSALQTLHELTEELGVACISQSKLGFDALLTLAILSQHAHDRELHWELWNSELQGYLDAFKARYAELSAEGRQQEARMPQIFVDAIESALGDALEPHATWHQLKQLLNQV